MKKQIFKALLVLAVVGSASAAMAAQTISGIVTIGSGTFSPSAKVVIMIASNATAYAATSAHLNGLKEYGTVGGANQVGAAGDPSKIYSKDYTTPSGKTEAQPSTPTSPTDLGWTTWDGK
jgi:hypothetical protein